jgi:outer membrane protein assembly factor BamB
MNACRHIRLSSAICTVVVFCCAGEVFAQAWPTYRHDNRRSGVTDAKLDFPLSQQWVWKSVEPPQTAWTGPAKWDAYSGNEGLQSMRNFDPCFYVTVDDDSVYFGSSVDDAAHALDVATGDQRWVHFTGAAVRMPPTVSDGRVYFGSDDGTATCCDAKSGKLQWQVLAAPGNEKIASNRKIISLWPVRTGVIVDDGKAAFAASLVPWQPSMLWTVDASTGNEIYQRSIKGVTLQGAMLASEELFYVPQGRAAPLAFARSDGKARGSIGEAGGVFCILTEDEQLFAGPGSQKGNQDEIRIGAIGSRESIASFSGTNRILVEGDRAWMSIEGNLKMLNRSGYVAGQQLMTKATKKGADKEFSAKELSAMKDQAKQQIDSTWKWEVELPAPLEMIKAGETLLVGLAGQVVALNAADGKELWRSAVEGGAHGLAVANGRLFVSTDRGHIYAFGIAK